MLLCWQKVEQLDAGEAPRPPSHTVDIIERKSEEEEDEENVFPGTDFLSVADVVQVHLHLPLLLFLVYLWMNWFQWVAPQLHLLDKQKTTLTSIVQSRRDTALTNKRIRVLSYDVLYQQFLLDLIWKSLPETEFVFLWWCHRHFSLSLFSLFLILGTISLLNSKNWSTDLLLFLCAAVSLYVTCCRAYSLVYMKRIKQHHRILFK